MAAKRSNSQAELINSAAFDPIANFNLVMGSEPPWESIVDFATHRSFCNQKLYPRQLTLLKLIYLETDHMTAYDLDVIEQWREGFRNPDMPEGVNEDIWTRIEYLKARGYRHFPHIEAIIGRRGSKGKIGGLLGCEKMAYMFSLDNWQKHYGVSPGKDGYLSVVATNSIQAKKFQFADIRETVESCKYLQPHIAELKDYCCVPGTPVLTADLRWVPVESLAVGDPIIGFEEYPGASRKRNWTPTRVTSTSVISAPTYRVVTDGATVECTDQHRWLARPKAARTPDLDTSHDEIFSRDGRTWIRRPCMACGASMELRPSEVHYRSCSRSCGDSLKYRTYEAGKRSGQVQWLRADELRPGDEIMHLGTWDSPDSADVGWMGGIYDGEGWLTSGFQLGFAQKPGAVLDKALDILDRFKFSYHTRTSATGVVNVVLNGTYPEVLRALGTFRPVRLLSKVGELLDGKSIKGDWVTVQLSEYVGTQEVIALATNSQTLMAAGMFSHNTLAIRTPADVRRIAYMHKNKIPIEHQVATLHAVAMSSNSSSGRGATGFANFFDEFAHMISGTGSQRSSEEVYEAYQPSLDQFGTDSLTYIPSSPFCLAPETPVLTEDLLWVPVGSLQLGDKLIGFDEQAPSEHGVGRRWRQTEVVETSIIQAPRYELTMRSGKKIIGTSEHLWLTKRVGGMGRGKGRGDRSQSYPQNWCWIKIGDLRPGDQIKSLGVDPWDEDNSRDAGYLAGFFDGEGHLSGLPGGSTAADKGLRGLNLGYSQNYGPVQEYVEQLLKNRGYEVQTYDDREGRIARVRIGGGMAEVMRFLGTVRPERLLPKFLDKLYGSRIYGPSSPAVDVVESVRYLDEGPVVALGTSTHTLVADGLLSHNTMTGHFYSLYEQGKVLMRDYDPETGTTKIVEKTEKELGYSDGEVEGNLIELTANPEMLVVQLPSWGLYEDWKKSPKLGGPYIKRPIQAYDERMMRYERSNPQKFAVERRSQFASVMDAFLDPKKVDAMFNNVPWRDPSVLAEQVQGRLDRRYYAHVDPGLTNANFAFTIGHLEDAPEDLDPEGVSWPHVIIDYMKVWKAKDFPDNTIDYVKVQREIAEVLRRFPSMVEFSADQWNSAGMLAALREEFGTRMTVRQETFTETANQERMERFKSALNLGWIHAYKDDFYEGGQKFAASDTAQSLLGMECKFLQRKPNGKVDKQDIGPVTTKDLFDTVNVVTDRMLKDHLDLWQAKMLGVQSPAIGSTDVAGLRSGRDLDRLAAMQRRPGGVVPVGVGSANMSAREKLRQQSLDRAFAKRMNSGGYTNRLRGHR